MNIDIRNTKIFYINLESNIERKETFQKNLNSLRLTGHRIDGVHGLRLFSNSYVDKIATLLDIPHEKLKPNYFTNRKNFSTLSRDVNIILPKVGCLLSHLSVLKKAYDEQIDNCLILEDDAVLLPDILKRNIEVPEDADICYLGGTFRHNMITDYQSDIEIIKIKSEQLSIFGTFAYYLPSKKSIKDLYRVTRSIFLSGKSKKKSPDWRSGQVRLMAGAYDRFLINHFQKNGNCYISNPILIYHEDNGFSNMNIKTNSRYKMKFYYKPSHLIYLTNQITKLTDSQKFNLVYLAKPVYGGWVSFTSHLSLKTQSDIYKVGKRSEKHCRDYGYNCYYQNLKIDDVIIKKNLLITAIDKNYYKYIDKFPDGTYIVIHDPTEVKGNSCLELIQNLYRFNVITIRKTVQEFLRKKYNIESVFLRHPFYEYPKTNFKKSGAVSVSRIDYDKHTDILILTNKMLKQNNNEIIKIYGAKNDRYVYRKLQTLDTMKEDDPASSYQGRFDKTFTALNNILRDKKFCIDMSAIKNDGGGSQYTFLESIYHDCVLVISEKWLTGQNDIFKNFGNCLVVRDEKDIFKIITSNNNYLQLIKESKKILKRHIDEDWTKILTSVN